MNKNRKSIYRKKGSPPGFRLPANVMEEEAWDDAGPSMKLSKAFVVVLVLHIVAVAGLAAFSFFEKKEAPKQADEPALPPNKTPAEIVNSEPLPADGAITDTGAAAADPSPTLPESLDGYVNVVLERSNTLGAIATQYGLTEEALIRYNPGLDSGEMILANTKIRLPGELVDRQKALAGNLARPEASTPATSPDSEVAQTERAPAKANPEVVQPRPRQNNSPPARRTPPVSKPPTDSKPIVRAEIVKKPGAASHTVKKGENLYRIGKRYGVTPEAICRANGIADPAKIAAGRTLIIPEP